MLLVIDVGNTNIIFGVFDGRDARSTTSACESARARTADEYAVLVRQMLALRGVDLDAASTRPSSRASCPRSPTPMVGLVRRAFGREALVVGPGHQDRDGDPLREPARGRRRSHRQRRRRLRVGEGRRHRRRLRHRDHLRLRDAQGRVPRRRDRARACRSAPTPSSRAPRSCHRVEIALPPRVVGRNTVHSMQSGIVYGYVGLVDGLVERLTKELGYPCRVVATGGLARLIAPQTEAIEEVDDDLTLTGLRLIYERNEHAEPRRGAAPTAERRRGLTRLAALASRARRSRSRGASSATSRSRSRSAPSPSRSRARSPTRRASIAPSSSTCACRASLLGGARRRRARGGGRGVPGAARATRSPSRTCSASPAARRSARRSRSRSASRAARRSLGAALIPRAALARRARRDGRSCTASRADARAGASGTSILLAGVVVNAIAAALHHVPQDARRRRRGRSSSSAGSRASSTCRRRSALAVVAVYVAVGLGACCCATRRA